MKQRITNTTKHEVRPDWLMDGNPDAILAQEAKGQEQLCQSTSLPKDCSPELRKTLEAAGVVFGDAIPGDPLFVRVTLPDGWEKRATDQSMWSDLVDGSGKVRAAIFYKAAFYDRSAFMREE